MSALCAAITHRLNALREGLHASDSEGFSIMTITRMWRGWTTPEAADDYERFLLDDLFPSMRAIPGFIGAEVLRRTDGAEVAFVTLTRFRSMHDIRTFAGDAIDRPVIEPRAAELLAHYDERALHYDSAVFHREKDERAPGMVKRSGVAPDL
jgi:heme-degrading monooxygenase HmoA